MKQIQYKLKKPDKNTFLTKKVAFIFDMLEALDFQITIPKDSNDKLAKFLKANEEFFDISEVNKNE